MHTPQHTYTEMEAGSAVKIILGLEISLILFYVGKVLFFLCLSSILFKSTASFCLMHLYFKPLEINF